MCRRRRWHPTPVPLPGKSHGWRSLVGCSPWGCEESDTTERLHFHFSLSCIGEGNGNPLQCSCLENPKDGGPHSCCLWGHTELGTTKRHSSISSNSSSVHAQRKVLSRTQWEGGHIQTRKRVLTRNQPCSTLILEFQPQELWENNFSCLGYLVCGVLLWWPEKTNIDLN